MSCVDSISHVVKISDDIGLNATLKYFDVGKLVFFVFVGEGVRAVVTIS